MLSILALVLFGAAIYGLWQPGVRISSVQVYGADSSLADYARQAMQGSYFGIVPRDSTFFVPTHRIRVAILAAYSDIAAISISRQGTTGLSIRPSMRTAVGRWCGSTYSPSLMPSSPTEGVIPYCYFFDPNGFVYAAVPETNASSTPPIPQTLNAFILYAPLDPTRDRPLAGDASEPPVVSGVEPLNATLANASKLPDVFAFARQLADFGSPADAVVIRGDEVDILLANGWSRGDSRGTRVTYVLGHEQDAYTALVSARASFNLANDSVDYIDLRFTGKVYVKKKGE